MFDSALFLLKNIIFDSEVPSGSDMIKLRSGVFCPPRQKTGRAENPGES